MAILKCKICGGDLEISDGLTVCECEYCGTKQTVPRYTDVALQNLYNRANSFRMKGEFDKAEEVYNRIIETDETQSEAYWGIILSRYGIEYIDDPSGKGHVPTCHRASYDAIAADDDYKSAIKYADALQCELYEAEAKKIDNIQKEILNVSHTEKPYDVFICYKETDENGRRTKDSAIANDIYYQLVQEGFKVFYAAITLEDKLGYQYEPYIFAALNSAKVMLVIGTKPEYFNAVWVKNEWSRYLKIIKNDRSKLLIPCYRDMDAYDLPDEFAHLQAQDMGKIGFISDISRGIKKVINVTPVVDSHPTPTPVSYEEKQYCKYCGELINKDSDFCPKCGNSMAEKEPIVIRETAPPNAKDKYVTLILCIFLGVIGAHKFYEGKIGKGILYLFTAGLFYIGWLCDLVKIISKKERYYYVD